MSAKTTRCTHDLTTQNATQILTPAAPQNPHHKIEKNDAQDTHPRLKPRISDASVGSRRQCNEVSLQLQDELAFGVVKLAENPQSELEGNTEPHEIETQVS